MVSSLLIHYIRFAVGQNRLHAHWWHFLWISWTLIKLLGPSTSFSQHTARILFPFLLTDLLWVSQICRPSHSFSAQPTYFLLDWIQGLEWPCQYYHFLAILPFWYNFKGMLSITILLEKPLESFNFLPSVLWWCFTIPSSSFICFLKCPSPHNMILPSPWFTVVMVL